MKKIVALFLVIGMLLCLFAGCRGEKDPGSSSTPPNAGTQADGEDDTVDYSKMKVGLLLTNVVVDGGWCQAQAEGLKLGRRRAGHDGRSARHDRIAV